MLQVSYALNTRQVCQFQTCPSVQMTIAVGMERVTVAEAAWVDTAALFLSIFKATMTGFAGAMGTVVWESHLQPRRHALMTPHSKTVGVCPRSCHLTVRRSNVVGLTLAMAPSFPTVVAHGDGTTNLMIPLNKQTFS